MFKSLVTVVIPIYNVENYLDRCIKSVVNQTYKNLEIILVDDGSPDSCPQICEEWAKKDKRIKVIHKENAGLGMARNTGIENSNGEYICFFDSDDYVDSTVIEKSYNACQKDESDIVVFGLSRVNNFGECVRESVPVTSKRYFENEEILEIFLPDLIYCDEKSAKNKNLALSACTCLFRTDLIKRNGCKFKSEREIISEDSYFLINLYSSVRKISIISEALYYYCENQSSLSLSYSSDRGEKLKHFYVKTLELCSEKKYNDTVKKRVSVLFFSFILDSMKQQVKTKKCGFKYKYNAIKTISKDEIVQKAVADIEKKQNSIFKSLFIYMVKHKAYFLIYILLWLHVTRR